MTDSESTNEPHGSAELIASPDGVQWCTHLGVTVFEDSFIVTLLQALPRLDSATARPAGVGARPIAQVAVTPDRLAAMVATLVEAIAKWTNEHRPDGVEQLKERLAVAVADGAAGEEASDDAS